MFRKSIVALATLLMTSSVFAGTHDINKINAVIKSVLDPFVQELQYLEELDASFDESKTDLSKQMVSLTAKSKLTKSKWSAKETILEATADVAIKDYEQPTDERAAEVAANVSGELTTDTLALIRHATNEFVGADREACEEYVGLDAPEAVTETICDAADSIRGMTQVSETYDILTTLKSEALEIIDNMLENPNLPAEEKAELEDIAAEMASIEITKDADTVSVKFGVSDLYFDEIDLSFNFELSDAVAKIGLDVSMPIDVDTKAEIMDMATEIATVLEKQDQDAKDAATELVGTLVYLGYAIVVDDDEF